MIPAGPSRGRIGSDPCSCPTCAVPAHSRPAQSASPPPHRLLLSPGANATKPDRWTATGHRSQTAHRRNTLQANKAASSHTRLAFTRVLRRHSVPVPVLSSSRSWPLTLCLLGRPPLPTAHCPLPSVPPLHWPAALLARRLRAKINAVGPRRGSIIWTIGTPLLLLENRLVRISSPPLCRSTLLATVVKQPNSAQ